MQTFNKHTGTTLFAALMAIAIAYSVFEYRVLTKRAQAENIRVQAENSVLAATSRYEQFLFDVNNRSTRFADFITQELNRLPNNHAAVLTQARKEFGFWQFIVFEDGLPILWDGFANVALLDSLYLNQPDISLSLATKNNVTKLVAQIPVAIKTDEITHRYQVVTGTRIAQDNILKIGAELELNPSTLFSNENEYPVRFQFSSIVPLNTSALALLSTPAQDTAGFVYTLADDATTYSRQLSKKQEITRGLYLSILLMLFIVLVFWISALLPSIYPLFIQACALGFSWWAFHSILPLFGTNPLGLAPNSVFIFYLEIGLLLVGASIMLRYLENENKSTQPTPRWRYSIIFLLGFTAPFLVYWVLAGVYQQVHSGAFFLFKQTLQETWPSLIFMFIVGTALLGLLTLLGLIARKIFVSHKHLHAIQSLTFLAGAAFSVFIFWVVAPNIYPSWLLVVILVFFITPLALAIGQSYLGIKLHRVSLLRAFLLLNVLSTSTFFWVGYLSHSNAEPERLAAASRQFILESEQNIQHITAQLLGRIHFAVSANTAFTPLIFDEIVATSIDESWLNYSISVQLIDANGALLSDYTTDLSAPQWSTDFNVNELLIPYQAERIRRTNLRPVIRNRPITTINAEYSSFRRGWVPVFEGVDSERITAWILVSVYKQLPEPNRPLRTVISTSVNNTGAPTISLVEYENRAPIRQSTVGSPGTIPGYSHLPVSINLKTTKDSTYLIRSAIRGQRLNEHYSKTSAGTIVRAASLEITYTQALYTFLRMYLILAVPFIFVLILMGLQNKWEIFGRSRRIRDRMIDRFIVASLLCLFTLVGVTYLIIDGENTQQVQSDLLSRLNDLVSIIENQDQANSTSAQYLENVTSILSEDAAIYTNAQLIRSTTPQIYSQHLLPSSLPWQVYYNIMVNGTEQEISFVQLKDFDMMIGYQPWFDANNEIAGIVAIPTFLRAPKFFSQVLSTTSYLLAFFSLIFGILMLSIGVISTRMTSPLQDLRGALMNISEGDLETRLPVTSNDEIGLLTRAYNAMSQRLKELQEKLAKTEREAAWKEMAQQVAHEIKNPLTPMKLNLQHLERQLKQTGNKIGENNPRILNITQSMIEQIDALNNIASDFSKFAKPIQHEFAPVALNDLVLSVADLYRQEAEITIVVQTSPIELTVHGVTEELRRCLVNLIKNAKEAMEGKGIITLSTQQYSNSQLAEITISDTGIGIPEKDQPNIFTPNFSTKTSGTGLGLAITKKIIEEHGGSISFTSQVGTGTTFNIQLPLNNRK